MGATPQDPRRVSQYALARINIKYQVNNADFF